VGQEEPHELWRFVEQGSKEYRREYKRTRDRLVKRIKREGGQVALTRQQVELEMLACFRAKGQVGHLPARNTSSSLAPISSSEPAPVRSSELVPILSSELAPTPSPSSELSPPPSSTNLHPAMTEVTYTPSSGFTLPLTTELTHTVWTTPPSSHSAGHASELPNSSELAHTTELPDMSELELEHAPGLPHTTELTFAGGELRYTTELAFTGGEGELAFADPYIPTHLPSGAELSFQPSYPNFEFTFKADTAELNLPPSELALPGEEGEVVVEGEEGREVTLTTLGGCQAASLHSLQQLTELEEQFLFPYSGDAELLGSM